jgi:threonine dehydrogenase-like Zn-dependent dehydrogenase
VILAGTGPVGVRAAVLLTKAGAAVTITSRALDRARDAAARLGTRFGVEVGAAEAKDDAGVARALEGAQICLTAGAAGVQMLPRSIWATHPTLRALGDVNAVPPTGIEGIEPGDKGTEREGKRVFGALGIGGLKMKVHKAAVAQLFEKNDGVLDLDAIWQIARAQ